MQDLIESLTRGNPTEVKVVLASVVAALAVYQLVLIAVTYGKLSLPFLGGRTAGMAHRSAGDAIVAITVIVAVMCLSYYGFEEGEKALHIVAGTALLVVLAFKVAVVRRLHGLGRYLPILGITVFGLFIVTWLSSAGDFLADR